MKPGCNLAKPSQCAPTLQFRPVHHYHHMFTITRADHPASSGYHSMFTYQPPTSNDLVHLAFSIWPLASGLFDMAPSNISLPTHLFKIASVNQFLPSKSSYQPLHNQLLSTGLFQLPLPNCLILLVSSHQPLPT